MGSSTTDGPLQELPWSQPQRTDSATQVRAWTRCRLSGRRRSPDWCRFVLTQTFADVSLRRVSKALDAVDLIDGRIPAGGSHPGAERATDEGWPLMR